MVMIHGDDKGLDARLDELFGEPVRLVLDRGTGLARSLGRDAGRLKVRLFLASPSDQDADRRARHAGCSHPSRARPEGSSTLMIDSSYVLRARASMSSWICSSRAGIDVVKSEGRRLAVV
jgi:hypothetical protein